MEYLKGSKEEFFDFLNSISKKDKVAVLSHTDLDGIASAVFMEEILKANGIKVKEILFRSYDDTKTELDKLKESDITKLFICDISVDSVAPIEFKNLRKEINVFWIDHHPLLDTFEYEDKIIKTNSHDCVALVIYNLGKGFIDYKKWNWLVCANMISEFSFKSKENLKFLQKTYSDVTEQNIFDSELGEISKKIGFASIYFRDNTNLLFELLLKQDIAKLDVCSSKVKKEVENVVEDFKKNAEFYPERNLYYYSYSPKFRMNSIASTIISLLPNNTNKTIILAAD